MRNSSKAAKLIVRLLVTLGIVWMAWLVYRDWDRVATHFGDLEPWWAFVTLGLGIVAGLHMAPVFQLIVNRSAKAPISFAGSARLLFVGQMIRHVPGRFWGIVYQVSEAQSHRRATAIIAANVEYMAVTMSFSALVPLVILLHLRIGPAPAVIVAAAGLLTVAAAIRYQVITRVLIAAGARLPRRIAEKAKTFRPERGYRWDEVALILLIMSSSWLSYVLAWQALGKAFPAATDENMLLLCAAYTIAWIIGFLSLVTPSGIGVREAAFLVLAPSDGLASLAVLAIIVRFWLLLTDTALSLLFFPYQLRTEADRHAS